MASLSVSLSNLLKSLSYQYAMASKQNGENQVAAANSSTTNIASTINLSTNNAISVSSASVSSTSNTAKTSTSAQINNKRTATNTSLSNLSKLLSNISKTTSTLNNTSVITNDMQTEFFKSYKNATMTAIYNKIQNGSAMTETDLANFKSQVAKLSTDEQKLWKTEIANIEKQISSKIPASTTVNTNNNANSNSGSNTNSSQAKTNTNTVANGFVSGVLYQNGTKYTGVYTDGKYYNNGVLATATVNGKYYYNGVLANGTVNGKTYENGVEVKATTTTTNTSSKDLTVTKKSTDANGNVLGYNASGKLVYLEKTVNGQKVVYTEELTYLNSKTITYLKSVDDAIISDRLMSDIKIVQNAEKAGLKAGAEGSEAYKNAYDASIKSQMIKTTSNMTGATGEVVEKNGSLYVNDGNGLVKLNISSETYLKLFAPIDRYDINQNNIGDCYFVSGCLTDMMKNDKSYSKLLQMFSEDSKGNITVKFAGTLSNYPVTFENGELKAVDGKVNGSTVKKYNLATGSLGTQMLEEAYAIAQFANKSNKTVSSIDIDETFASIQGGVQNNVYKEVLGISNVNRTEVSPSNLASYLNSVASKVNNGDMFLSFASYGTTNEYGLTNQHAYSIEKIDTKNQLIYISNPWYAGEIIPVPYSVFEKTAYTLSNKIYFSYGYLNS